MTGVRIGRLYISTSILIWLLLADVSVGGLINSVFHTGTVVYYLADFINVLLVIFIFRHFRRLSKVSEMKILIFLFAIYLISILIGCVGNAVPIHFVLWGARNTFRYIIFFIACCVLLDDSDIDRFESVLGKLYISNFVLVLYQYFGQGLMGDNVGGLMGTLLGCNGALIIFLNILISFFVGQYICKRISMMRLCIYVLIYFLCTALSETKGNYVFFIVVVLVAIVISKKNFKVLGMVLVGGLALVAGVYFLSIYFPQSVDFLLNIDKANNYMDASYYGTTTFTRNSLLNVADSVFFKDNLWHKLFGFGLGACDMSGYFITPFYAAYGYMNYRQYGVAMTVLQTGYIGLIIYIGFFIAIFGIAFIWNKRISDSTFRSRMVIAACVAVFAIVDSVYASLYADMSYWVFFVLAIPIIQLKQRYISINEGVLP